MSLKTPLQTALMLALILMRSELARARLSTVTVRLCAGRKHLKAAFIRRLIVNMEDLNWAMAELDTGGFGCIRIRGLEGAKPVTAKKYLTEDEIKAMRKGLLDYDGIEAELALAPDPPEDD